MLLRVVRESCINLFISVGPLIEDNVKLGIYCILPKLFVVTSTLSSHIVEGILYGRNVDNQEKKCNLWTYNSWEVSCLNKPRFLAVV